MAKEKNEILLPAFKNNWNARLFPKRHESKPSTQPSMTQPDQSMSVFEILKRYASGQPITGIRTGYYEEEQGTYAAFDLEKLDLAEIQELKENLAVQEKKMKVDLQRQAKEKQQKQKPATPIENAALPAPSAGNSEPPAS